MGIFVVVVIKKLFEATPPPCIVHSFLPSFHILLLSHVQPLPLHFHIIDIFWRFTSSEMVNNPYEQQRQQKVENHDLGKTEINTCVTVRVGLNSLYWGWESLCTYIYIYTHNYT